MFAVTVLGFKAEWNKGDDDFLNHFEGEPMLTCLWHDLQSTYKDNSRKNMWI